MSRIVDSVAEAENTDPLALQPPLAAVVDPDARELRWSTERRRRS